MDNTPLSEPQQAVIAALVALDADSLVARLLAIAAEQGLAQDLQRAYARNSLRTASADWRGWCAFCVAAGEPVLPATVDSLRRFLEAQVEAKRARATLDHYLWTLRLVHRLAELPWPLATERGRLMWRGVRHTVPKYQHQKHGLTLDEVECMLAVMGDAPADLRDAAVLSVASEVLARPSDAVALHVEQLTFKADGTGRVLFAKSKTDQEGEGAFAAISAECVSRLRRWLAHAELVKGPLFRSIPVIDKPRAVAPLPGRYGWPLSTRDIQRIYKRRAAAAGLDETNISGHSPRIGSTQDMVAAGLSGPAIQQQGRWKSERMVVRYSEHLRADRGAMPQLLELRRAGKATR